MTDNSQYPIQTGVQGIPKTLQYGLSPMAAKSRSYRVNYPAMNGSIFAPGGQPVFEIPVGKSNTFLDQTQCFIKFGIQCTSTAACAAGGSGIYIDNSAYSFFQTQTIINGGCTVEPINQYGQLANYLLDNTISKSQKVGMSSQIGCNPYTNLIVAATAAAPTYGGNAAAASIFQTEGDRSGLSLASVISTAGINTAPVYNFCLPILSGIIGANATKMIPLGRLKVPIRIEYILSQNDDAIYYGTAGAGAVWQMVNPELFVTIVEISGPEVVNPNERVLITTSSYRQTSANILSTQSGDFNIILPFHFSSVNALYCRFRNQAAAVQGANATAAYRLSSSVNPNLSSYYFKINNANIPQKAVYLINGYSTGSGSEAQAELAKSFHSLASIIGEPAYGAQNYNVSTTAYANGQWAAAFAPGAKSAGAIDTHANAFSIGLECQTFSNNTDTILSGMNTQNAQMFFQGTIYSGLTAAQNITVDVFCGYDVTLVIQDGLMTVIT